MYYVIEAFMELFGYWFEKSVFRVYLGAVVFFAPFALFAYWLWGSNSSLLIFAGPLASKILAVLIVLVGLNYSVGVLIALAEGNSARHYFGEGER